LRKPGAGLKSIQLDQADFVLIQPVLWISSLNSQFARLLRGCALDSVNPRHRTLLQCPGSHGIRRLASTRLTLLPYP
jgi:hypothetical protein